MDGVLCVWDSRAIRAEVLGGHKGSISKVLAQGLLALSSGYDGQVIVWDVSQPSRSRQLLSMAGVHKQPVLDMAWQNSLVVTGDKGGKVAMWDVNRGVAIREAIHHKGAVAQIALHSDYQQHHLVITAGQEDGLLHVTDMRSHAPLMKHQLHQGSINSLVLTPENQIVTGSHDSTLAIVDVAAHGFDSRKIGRIQTDSPVHCVSQCRGVLLSGHQDGNVLAHESRRGKSLWGYGAMKTGVVRQLAVNDSQDTLVAIGDDPAPLIMYFH